MSTDSPQCTAAELVSRLFAVIDGERWDELGSVFAEEAVCHRPGAAPLTGLAAIEGFYRHQRPIAAGRHEIEHALGDDGTAACWGEFTGRTRSGAAVAERIAEVYHLREGLIVRRTTYLHRA